MSLKPTQLSLCRYCWSPFPELLKRTNVDLARMDVEHVPKNQQSPQMIKRPPKTIVHKDPQSHQPTKIDHVENGHEGQSEPSQKL